MFKKVSKKPTITTTKKKILVKFKKRRIERKKARSKVQPHRSFRLTRRRDYVRSLEMPGYISFAHEVSLTLWKKRRLFGSLIMFYALVVIIVGGVSTQEGYIEINNFVTNVTAELPNTSGGLSTIANAGTVLLSSLGGSDGLTDVQQIYLVLALLLVWLTTVWLLRELKAGRSPKLRDGLYNAGSPILATTILMLVFLIQLLPIAVAAIVYAALVSVGLASEGFGAMIAILGVAMVAALTLYWLTSTFIALVVVTLPGMYPMRALRAASNLVVSRRLRVMYRLLWMILLAVAAWAVIMIPLIILEAWVRGSNEWLSAVPTIPFLITAMSAVTTIWITAYVYLMYRKLVDDDSTPG